jgi:hypothetical protein
MRRNKKPIKAQGSSRLLSRKSGQEEMVGFGLILILVAIIFIVFIALYIRKPTEKVNDYETNSFIQSVLQYTTTCEESNLENLTVQEVIFKCQQNDPCDYRNMDPCSILNTTLKGIIRESWEVNPKSPVKGYNLAINVSDDGGETEVRLLNLKEGVVTNNYRGSEQDFGKSGDYISILFQVYG